MIKLLNDFKDDTNTLSPIENFMMKENGLSLKDYQRNFPDLNQKYRYFSFKDIIPTFSKLINTDKFVKFVLDNSKKKFVIAGDYDTDGIMSVLIFMIVFRKLGISVNYATPNRLSEGYGMSESLVDRAIEKGAQCIITVDNGISCFDSVAYAKSKGIDVFITDHHLPTEGCVPENVEIVDPAYNHDKFEGICGAFVAAKLAKALMDAYHVDDQYLLQEIFTYAAIATVTDMMPVLNENRLLLRASFNYVNFIKEKKVWCRTLKVISSLGGRFFMSDPDRLSSEDLYGYSIGPTINAVSRVEGDVEGLIYNMLTCDERGKWIDKEYENINSERKRRTQEMMANHVRSKDPVDIEILDESAYDFPISGLTGLIAGQVSNLERKVSLVGYDNNGEYELSCRSIPGYNLHDAYERIRESHPELNLDGGGHASAMGIRLPAEPELLNQFKQLIIEDFNNHKGDVLAKNYLKFDDDQIDGVVNTLQKYEVFGTGFKAPQFVYRGKFKGFSNNVKTAAIGDYSFKYFTTEDSAYNYLNKEVEVYFSIKFDSKNGPYFKVDNIKRMNK